MKGITVVNENLVPHPPGLNIENQNQPSPDFFTRYNKEEAHKRPMSVTIKRSLEDVSAIVNDIQNLPLFMENLEAIESVVDGHYNWRFRDEDDYNLELRIPMVVELNKLKNTYVWESEDAAGFKYSVGLILEHAAANRGTVARMMVMYESAAGDLVGLFEKLFGNDAEMLSKRNLIRLQAFCETGHVPTTQGQPSGRDEDKPSSMKH